MDNSLFKDMAFSGDNIRRIRENANCTQKEFAEMMNVSTGTLRNWEQGRRAPDGAAIALLKVFSKNASETARAISSYTRSHNFSDKKKREILRTLNWDYNVDVEELLNTVKNKNNEERKRLFVKTFEYLHWQDVVRFWGSDSLDDFYNQSIRKMIIPSLRSKYDFIFGKIYKTNLSDAGYCASDCAELFKSILSHRRNSSESGIS